MIRSLSCLSLAAALSLAGAAHAVSLTSSVLNGNALNTDFSSAELISFDLALRSGLPVSLTFTYALDEADIARGGVGLNAIIADYSGMGIPGLRISLIDAAFGLLGTAKAVSSAGEVLSTNPVLGAGVVAVDFSLTEGGVVNEVYLGDPFSEGLQDWRVSFDGLQSGDHFTLNVTVVPEPAAWALMLAGLGLLAWRRTGRA